MKTSFSGQAVAMPSQLTISAQLPDMVTGTSVSFQCSASGGMPPYSFSQTGFPASLSISSGGLVTGTWPSSNFSYTISVADANG